MGQGGAGRQSSCPGGEGRNGAGGELGDSLVVQVGRGGMGQGRGRAGRQSSCSGGDDSTGTGKGQGGWREVLGSG